MILSVIAAMSENRVIGRGNRLPWHLPQDLQRFKSITMGHPLVMGRKTFESIGRPLPGRRMVVISRRPGYQLHGCETASSLERALEILKEEEEVFICGGGEIFAAALPLAHRIYLTVVHAVVEGDTFFPPIPGDFVEVSRERGEEEVPIDFILLERRGGSRASG